MKKLSSLKLTVVFGILLVGLLALYISGASKAFAATDSCTPPATTYGTDTMTMSVPTTTTYTIWTRMQAPSASSNSILLNIDKTSCYNIGGSSSMPVGAWTWVNYNDGSSSNVIKLSLSQGPHTLVLTGTKSGVSIDRIEALSDSTCTPSGTGDNCTPIASNPPTISITAPSGGATVSGTTTLSASASASSPATIKSVQFKLDGSNLGPAVTTSPYSYSWNTTTAANSSHSLSAVATDSNNSTTTSSPVAVTVNNSTGDTIPPTVKFTSPTANQTVKGTVAVAASATDNVGVTKVQFYVDGVLASSVTASPYNYSWDTTKVASGSHVLKVSAYDAAGNFASSQVTVVVQNTDTQPPSTPSGVTATAKSATQVNLGWTASTDNVGVTGYYVLRSLSSGGFTTIGQVSGSTTTYTDATVSPKTTYNYEIEAHDAAGNVSPASKATAVTTPAQADTQPPSTPTNVAATAVSSSQINLSWTASTDNVGVTGYDIYRNGVKLITVTSTSLGDTGLKASTAYSYYVIARDAAGNSSPASNTVSATTLSSSTTNDGNLTGIITDPRGSPLSGTTVYCYVNGGGVYAETTSNRLGAYSFTNIPAGSQEFRFESSTWGTQNRYITIIGGQTTTWNVTL